MCKAPEAPMLIKLKMAVPEDPTAKQTQLCWRLKYILKIPALPYKGRGMQKKKIIYISKSEVSY